MGCVSNTVRLSAYRETVRRPNHGARQGADDRGGRRRGGAPSGQRRAGPDARALGAAAILCRATSRSGQGARRTPPGRVEDAGRARLPLDGPALADRVRRGVSRHRRDHLDTATRRADRLLRGGRRGPARRHVRPDARGREGGGRARQRAVPLRHHKPPRPSPPAPRLRRDLQGCGRGEARRGRQARGPQPAAEALGTADRLGLAGPAAGSAGHSGRSSATSRPTPPPTASPPTPAGPTRRSSRPGRRCARRCARPTTGCSPPTTSPSTSATRSCR